ncbi:hypothetical protein [Vibrio pectenicida]|uniref:Uncharacterized protein n=2 Tax=Vibrio TaxID=662 RepID=A0A3R9KZW8_9VIBR|nr:hypothetical protein [Vibrio pectenicida]RSD29844.1 hypothetical protein EJA03_16980 [Vibrio pectenicida]
MSTGSQTPLPYKLARAPYSSDSTPLVFSGSGLSSIDDGRDINEVVQNLESISLSIFPNIEEKNDAFATPPLSIHRSRRDTRETSSHIVGLSEQEFAAAINASEVKFADTIHTEKYGLLARDFTLDFYLNELDLSQYLRRVKEVVDSEVSKMQNQASFSGNGEYICQLYAILVALCNKNQDSKDDELWCLKKASSVVADKLVELSDSEDLIERINHDRPNLKSELILPTEHVFSLINEKVFEAAIGTDKVILRKQYGDQVRELKRKLARQLKKINKLKAKRNEKGSLSAQERARLEQLREGRRLVSRRLKEKQKHKTLASIYINSMLRMQRVVKEHGFFDTFQRLAIEESKIERGITPNIGMKTLRVRQYALYEYFKWIESNLTPPVGMSQREFEQLTKIRLLPFSRSFDEKQLESQVLAWLQSDEGAKRISTSIGKVTREYAGRLYVTNNKVYQDYLLYDVIHVDDLPDKVERLIQVEVNRLGNNQTFPGVADFLCQVNIMLSVLSNNNTGINAELYEGLIQAKTRVMIRAFQLSVSGISDFPVPLSVDGMANIQKKLDELTVECPPSLWPNETELIGYVEQDYHDLVSCVRLLNSSEIIDQIKEYKTTNNYKDIVFPSELAETLSSKDEEIRLLEPLIYHLMINEGLTHFSLEKMFDVFYTDRESHNPFRDLVNQPKPEAYRTFSDFIKYSQSTSREKYNNQFYNYQENGSSEFDASQISALVLANNGLSIEEIVEPPKTLKSFVIMGRSLSEYGDGRGGTIRPESNPCQYIPGRCVIMQLSSGRYLLFANFFGDPKSTVVEEEELSRFMGSIEKSGLSSFEKAWLMPEEAPRHFKRYTGMFCDWAAKNFVSLLYDGDTNPFEHAVHPFYTLVKDTQAKPIKIGSSAPDTLPNGIKEALDTLAIDFQAAFDDTNGFHKFVKAIVPFYETIYNRTTDRRYIANSGTILLDLLSVIPLFGAVGKVGKLSAALGKQGMRALISGMAKGLRGGRLIRYVARGMSTKVLAASQKSAVIMTAALYEALVPLPVPTRPATAKVFNFFKFKTGGKTGRVNGKFGYFLGNPNPPRLPDDIIPPIGGAPAPPAPPVGGLPVPPPVPRPPSIPNRLPPFSSQGVPTKTRFSLAKTFNKPSENDAWFAEMYAKGDRNWTRLTDSILEKGPAKSTAGAFETNYKNFVKIGQKSEPPVNVKEFIDGETEHFKIGAKQTPEGELPKAAYDLYVSKDGKSITTSSSYKSDDYSKTLTYADIMYNAYLAAKVDAKNLTMSIQASIENSGTQQVIDAIGGRVARANGIRVTLESNPEAFKTLLATDNVKATVFMLTDYGESFGYKTIKSIDIKGSAYLVINIE